MKKIMMSVAALSMVGAIAAPVNAAACRNAQGKFIKCAKAASAAKGTKCRDAHGKFIKCK